MVWRDIIYAEGLLTAQPSIVVKPPKSRPKIILIQLEVESVYKPNLGWKGGGRGCRRATSAVDGTMWDGDK